MIDDILKKFDKKYLYIIGGIVLFVIILVGLASCSNTNENGVNIGYKKDSWSKIEDTMVKATKDYLSEFPHYYPDEGETKTIKVSTLVTKEYMYSLDNYVSDGIKCTGRIDVTNINNDYDYTPILDCGKAYSAVPLYEYIINKYEDSNSVYLEKSAESHYSDEADYDGLYTNSDNSEYYFRGKITDNFVKINETLWRIISIDENGYTYIISDNSIESNYWDNAYNPEFLTTEGRNDFNISYIKGILNNGLSNEKVFPDSILGKLIKTKWCIGKRSETETTKDGSVECGTLSEPSYIGLLSVYQYLRASTDNLCTTTSSRECSNYNFLNLTTFWTLTANSTLSNKVYNVSSGVGITDNLAKTGLGINYVVVLNTNAIKSEGTGTEKDPLVIK